MPEEWGFDEEHARGPVRGAALPMGFNRTPHYDRGVLLVGDAGGMVNPFNGEGIAYAMESGELAAEVIAQALARPAGLAARAGAARLPEGTRRPLRRLLHGRPGVRESDRQARCHAAADPPRAAASDHHAVHA